MAGRGTDVLAMRNCIVKISGIADNWSAMAGAEVSSATTKVRQGGARKQSVITGPQEYSNATIRRPYVPNRDLELGKLLYQQTGAMRATITRQWVDGNHQAIGRPQVLGNCLLVRVHYPDYDEQSNEAGYLETEWAIESIG